MRVGWMVLLLWVFTSGCDDGASSDDPFKPACRDVATCGAASARLQPEVFRFPSGEHSEIVREVRVTNLGNAPLLLRNLQVELGSSVAWWLTYRLENTDGVTQQVRPLPDGQLLDVVTVPAGHRLVWMLTLRSAAPSSPGTLGFETNDPERRRVLVPIVRDAPPVLTFEPARFQQLPADPAPQAALTNGGGEALLDRFEVDGPYALEVENGPPLWAEGERLRTEPVSVSTDLRFIVRPDDENATGPGRVRFRTNDPNHEQVELPILPPPAPQLQIEPRGLDFGPQQVGSRQARTVRLTARGEAPLNVERIAVSPGAGFTLDHPQLPVTLHPLDGPAGWLDVTVHFEPHQAIRFASELRVQTNDPVAPQARLPLKGQGVGNQCPVAGVARSELTAAPLSVVTLDGSPSGDVDGPGGRPVQYRWQLRGPPGMPVQVAEWIADPTVLPHAPALLDLLETSDAAFVPMLPGQYVADLTVEDDAGQVAPGPACQQPRAAVRVNVPPPQEGLFIALSFPEVPPPGTDVDLHLLRPGGLWGHASDDCFAGNPAPIWGEAGNPQVIRHGAYGPELIHLPDPARFDAAPDGYRIGVHAAALSTPVEVQVQVYTQGQARGGFRQVLQAEGDFWVAAQVIWPREVNALDEPIFQLP